MTGAPLVVLNFHGVGDPPRPVDAHEAAVWLTRDALDAALDVAVGRADVRITFDDGNASDLAIAVPALARRGLRAAFYVPAGLLGTSGRLDAAQVRELVAAGMGVGSHGLMHRAWRGLPDAELHEEIAGSRRRIEEICGRPVVEAACPFGSYDRRALRVLRESGYRIVYTSDGGAARDSAWLQPRNTIHAGDGPDDVRRIVERRPGLGASALRATKLAVKRWR